MPSFLPDTSCMVAAVCTWHEHHQRAVAELERRLARETMVTAAPAIVEAYAVLTRLPPPHRLSPADAHALLEANFIRPAKMVTLNPGSYRALLRRAPEDAVVGGRIHDAVIAACAVRARASVLLTFNASDFFPFSTEGRLEVVIPAETRL